MEKPDFLTEPLTKRELEILSYLFLRQSNREIADALSLSINSVKWYARQIYTKLGVENRRQAILKAGELGLLLTSFRVAAGDERLPALPSTTLKGSDLPRQVLAEELPRAFPPYETAALHAHNLPVQITSFVGRETDIRDVNQILAANRLITLYGSGGIGKTRLALQVAAGQLERFSAGAWLVELAPLTDPETVPQTIAAALGLQRLTTISYQAMLANYLREKQLLLVVDNCEHVLEVCARLAEHLLRTCPRLTLLVTSRETLQITGEVAYRVPSLPAPDPTGYSPADLVQAEAVRLFAERAAAVLPGFRLTDQTLTSVARLCHRLDGIPLAIELAAARVNVLAVEQIAARLDDAFRLLSDGSRTALPRQRTLRGSIDWSYSLLAEPERLLLQRLSVFSGGWTLEAAEQVCAFDALEKGQILDGLASLVHKSLVLADPISNGLVRYRMLETIRQFAQEKLRDSDQHTKTHDFHLNYFVALAEEYGPFLRTPRVVALLDALDLEVDNLRGAIALAVGRGNQESLEKAISILYPLMNFWFTRALVSEVDSWVDSILSHRPGSAPLTFDLRAKALFLQGFLHTVYSLDIEKALQTLRESVRLFRQVNNFSGEGLASGLLHMALSQIVSWDYYERFRDIRDTAEAELVQTRTNCLAIANILITQPDLQSRWTVANILWWMDFNPPFADRRNSPQRRNFLHKARFIFTELGDRLGEVNILTGLDYIGFSAPGENEPPYPYLILDQGLELAQRLKSKFSLVWLTSQSGLVAYFAGNYQKMVDNFQTVCSLFKDTGQLWGESWSFRMIGVGYYYLGDIPQALIIFRESIDFYFNRLGNANGVYQNLIFIAGISSKVDLNPLAVKLVGFIERHYENHYMAMEQMEKIAFDQTVSNTKLVLNEDEYVSLWQQGREMTFEQALADVERIDDDARKVT